ncbi:MAG TPA: cytochrome b/b6 domain-containing protein [Rhizomicrobium sp.]|nr:cytochrome b/b6 domain-containing protein [Rhizomicrobium sp.]
MSADAAPPRRPVTTRAAIRVTIWDWPTRLIHWSIVVLIAFAWWAYKGDRMLWHERAGYAVLALLALRLFLGLFGSETSRFAQFVRGPGAVWRYLRGAVPGVGHNPLGAWSVVLLLGVLAGQAVLGLFASDEDGLESGPLSHLVTLDHARLAEELHGLLFNILLGLVALHVAAIVFYALRGRNLLWPMIAGRGPLPEGARAPRLAPLYVVLLGMALAAALFVWFWRLSG